MKPLAFVVMPFGPRSICEANAGAVVIDFNAVFKKLLEPALNLAGFDAVRADSETGAGDIRTDMFFELVTADLVVADISIANLNVFYELGVRHGVCPKGVFVVQGDLGNPRPFDVAPDRTFSYTGSLFAQSTPALPHPAEAAEAPQAAGHSDESEHRKLVNEQVERLCQTFKHALTAERESTGSPVYQHLPGLQPVNWDKIETSKASYFGSLSDNWLDCVRLAQSKGHPGDILTLAEDAPTRLHRTKILFEAARALIDLCRYGAAERVLREVLQLDPKHAEAQLQLGRVFAHQGRSDEAEHHLRNIQRQHEDDPDAGDLLGQVSRQLWHLSWRDEPKKSRREKALDTSPTAALAIHSFIRAQKRDARAFYAGFNALILIALLEDLRKGTGRAPAEILPANLEEVFKELIAVVTFCAKNSKERAIETGDYVAQFLTTTTLSGIALIENDEERAIQRMREACSIPEASFFQLNTLQERLLLYDELDFCPNFVKPALDLVREALTRKNRHNTCKRVFLWSGYPVDKEGQQSQRFPAASLKAVEKRIEEALEHWKVGPGDLAICDGVHEGDILFATACRNLKARVRMMMLQPVDGQPHQALWPFATSEWEQRFHDLRSSLGEDVWFQSDHLGPSPEESSAHAPRSLDERHKSWLINTARMEAEPALDARSKFAANPAGRLFGLFLWNGEGDGESPESPAYLIRRVNEFNGYEGQVKTISALSRVAAP